MTPPLVSSDQLIPIAQRGMYARVSRSHRLRESGPPLHRDSLLFVDVEVPSIGDVQQALGHIRFLAPIGLGHISTVIVRWPQTGPHPDDDLLQPVHERIGWMLDQLGVRSSVAIASAGAGEEVRLTWGPGHLGRGRETPQDEDLLAACRAIEVGALLSNGRAVWNPAQYHYRLPSGKHSGTFVRLADAIRSVRDADVLAWWLLRYAKDGLALVLDSTTLVPVALAIRREFEAAGFALGPVETLTTYPATGFDFTKALRSATRGEAPVLGLLSVSSSGSVRVAFVDALSTAVPPAEWALETFVDKSQQQLFIVPSDLGDQAPHGNVWLGLGAGVETAADGCRLCSDPSRARIVHIDPKSFDGLVLPEPELLTPDIRFADRARPFWEAADRAGAIHLDAAAHPSAAHVRPQNSTMGVVVDFDPLLEKEFEEDQPPALALELKRRWSHLDPPDLIVLSESESNRSEGRGQRLAESVFADLAPQASIVTIPAAGDEVALNVKEQIAHAERIGIFSLGIVTGTTLHRVLAVLSDVRRNQGLPAARIDSFVVHARLDSQRSLDTVMNPFGSDCFHIGFESLLPDAVAPSPLRDEQVVLSAIDPARITDDGAKAFLDARMEVLSAGAGSDHSIFWGTDSVADGVRRLRPGSLYGESLSELAAFVAVGSAVHRRRESRARGGAPEWRQFEIPAIVRSYFDPLIVCSVMRWLRPEECWWGREAKDAERVISEFVAGYSDRDELRVVVAELLLAGAQGKVPSPAMRLLADRASALIDQDEDKAQSLRLGVFLATNRLAETSA